MRSSMGVLAVALFLALTLLGRAPRDAEAASSPVPSTQYPTIQAAVDDPSCSELPLGAQTYAESVTVGRSLNVVGVSSGTTADRSGVAP
jgi:hypothetical protein